LVELYEHPELAKQYLLEAYYLVDLRSDNVAKIKKDKKATLAELALHQGGISKDFCDWLDMHEALLSEPYCIYSEEVYLYIFTMDARKAILDRIDKIKDPTQRQLAMSVAQQLRQEGRQEGMHTKALDIAKNMLANLHLDMQTVAQATGLSQEELMNLQEEKK
jgi:predicted transposase/invertase (TIGR01784 family)